MASKTGDSVLAWLGGIVSGVLVGVGVVYLATGGGQSSTASPSGGTTAGATGPSSGPSSGSTSGGSGTSSSGGATPAAPVTTAAPTWTLWSGTSPIPNGDVRISLSVAQMQALLTAAQLPVTAAGLVTLITNPAYGKAFWSLQGTDVTVYQPGQALPGDWPTAPASSGSHGSNDPNAPTNWFLDIVVTSGPVPASHAPGVNAIWIHQEPIAVVGVKA